MKREPSIQLENMSSKPRFKRPQRLAGRYVVRLAGLLTILFLLPFATASALPPYPEPPYDFAHPSALHNAGQPLYSPAGGNDDRPMLVILVQFSDVAPAAGRNAAFYADWVFGPFPSLVGYFNANSFGRLLITPAPEVNIVDGGAFSDGVVVVQGGNYADFTALTEPEQNTLALQGAEGSVMFETFDANGDGSVTADELIVLVIRTSKPTATNPDSCGATRASGSPLVDGKTIVTNVAMGATGTNLITHIHEVGHSALDQRDLYGFGVGAFDISGPSCGASDDTFFGTSAWQKTHWGWITPTVVAQDGYYLVDRADGNPEAFILYDPSKGTNDYFIVENRQKIVGTYDQSASDSGLVIWRIDDTQYNSAVDTMRPIEIMRPDGSVTGGCDASGTCYSGSDIDAWNPTSLSTPQRTMARTWRDGTASNVAVRAIGPSGNAIRAYFDVRGPGILIDPTTPSGQVLQVGVTPEESNPVTFAVMNTGESTDDFEFTIQGLPSGWSATVDTKNGLGAGIGSTATIQVTPSATAPVGVVTATARGKSKTNPAIVTTAEVRLRVELHPTRITYTGSSGEPWGEQAGFAARLSDLIDGDDIVQGASVEFHVWRPALDAFGPLLLVNTTVISDADGLATANPVLPPQPGSNQYLIISSARRGKHAAATITVPYAIQKRATTIDYTGDTTEDYSDPTDVSATLTDTLSGGPLTLVSLSGPPLIRFAVGVQTATDLADAAGAAAAIIVINQPAGPVAASATFAGDGLYLGSSGSDPFTITKETLSFTYTGDTLVALGAPTATLRSVAVQEADGSPGDLALAQANFRLAPTLTLVPFEFLAGVDGSGASSTPAAGLPVDLWTLTVAVPSSNLYWEGTSTAAVEIVLYDPRAVITGAGHGLDATLKRASIAFKGQYKGAVPEGEVEFVSSAGRFKGTKYDWIIVVSGKTIFQMRGVLDKTEAAILRVTAQDRTTSGIGGDTFSARLRTLANVTIYESGTVTLQAGNLRIVP